MAENCFIIAGAEVVEAQDEDPGHAAEADVDTERQPENRVGQRRIGPCRANS